MSNTRYWDALKRPPGSALKTIDAGRLKGKSDISPQWRTQAMTEQFGPCGIGWRYEIVNVWSVPAGEEVFAFAQVNLYIREEGEWSEAIPGIGGSKLMQSERNGIHANDEGFKMALTDALSVAMKQLGVAADIYLGLWDGSKYIDRDDVPQKRNAPNGSKPNGTEVEDAKAKTTEYLEKFQDLPEDFAGMAAEDIKRAKTLEDVRKVYQRIQKKAKEEEFITNV